MKLYPFTQMLSIKIIALVVLIMKSKALEFLNQALFNYEIFTVNREKMRINITDKEFDRKSILKDSILNKSRIKDEAEKLLK